jgi:hypothetical protein
VQARHVPILIEHPRDAVVAPEDLLGFPRLGGIVERHQIAERLVQVQSERVEDFRHKSQERGAPAPRVAKTIPKLAEAVLGAPAHKKTIGTWNSSFARRLNRIERSWSSALLQRGRSFRKYAHADGLVAGDSACFAAFAFSFIGSFASDATSSFSAGAGGTYGCSGLKAMMLIGGRVNSAE